VARAAAFLVMTTENTQSTPKSSPANPATTSEPRIQIAPDVRQPKDRETLPTLPDFDLMAATVEDGYAHDTIPAPPLPLEDEEPEAEKT